MVQSGFVKTDWPECKYDVTDSADAVAIAAAGLTIKIGKAAAAEGLPPATFKAFANAWHLSDDYLTNPGIKSGLEQVLQND